MRIFDSPWVLYCTNAFSVFVWFTILFLIVTIWVASPPAMRKFKKRMLKMAISDLLFTTALEFFFIPDLLFPLPAAVFTGLAKYFGQIGCNVVYVATIVFGASTLTSVLDCCFYRFFIFYKLDGFRERSDSWVGIAYLSILNGSVTIVIGSTPFFTMDYQELVDYADRHDLLPLLKQFNVTSKTLFFGTDLDNPLIVLGGFGGGAFIAVVEAGNFILTILVKRKIDEAKPSMSKETLQIQKSLTQILFAHAAIPGIAISIPVIIQMIGMVTKAQSFVQSKYILTPSIFAVAGYPLVNSVVCLYGMKTYKQFCKKCVAKMLFCFKFDTSPVLVADVNPSSAFTGES